MSHEYQAKYPEVAHKIKFYIGDVRSLESCRSAMPGTDYIFHAAALKQVPSCEFFPMEAVKTNVIRTDNVLTAAIEAKVKCVIERSIRFVTRKDFYPKRFPIPKYYTGIAHKKLLKDRNIPIQLNQYKKKIGKKQAESFLSKL